MAALFSKPKMPEVKVPDPLPPPPDRTDEETARLAESQRSRFARRGGRANTMLTGGRGDDSASTAMRFLGGVART